MIDKMRAEKAVRELLLALGEDVEREGLKDTPKRVVRMYEELLFGMDQKPKEHLKFFTETSQEGEPVIIRDIPVRSICEHHLLPFIGTANIAYIPQDGKIIGLSKFARIIDCFAKRFQVQERLTSEVAEFIFKEGKSQGVLVTVEAEHLCMTMRGIKAVGSMTKTISCRGILKDDPIKRAEVLDLMKKGGF